MKKLFIVFIFVAMPAMAETQADYSRILGDLSARITELEEENRRLYGRIEELEYNFDKLAKNASSMKVKQEYYVSKPGDKSAEYVIRVDDSSEKPVEFVGEDEEIPFEKAANSEDEAKFNEAFAKLGKEDYKSAKVEFNEFIKNYPSSEYTAQSYFWLGEIAVKEKSTADAAVNYLKAYKADSTGKRAAESLIKLVQNLRELGKKGEACKNIERFNAEFPDAHSDLKNKAKNEAAKLSCS